MARLACLFVLPFLVAAAPSAAAQSLGEGCVAVVQEAYPFQGQCKDRCSGGGCQVVNNLPPPMPGETTSEYKNRMKEYCSSWWPNCEWSCSSCLGTEHCTGTWQAWWDPARGWVGQLLCGVLDCPSACTEQSHKGHMSCLCDF